MLEDDQAQLAYDGDEGLTARKSQFVRYRNNSVGECEGCLNGRQVEPVDKAEGLLESELQIIEGIV